MEDLGGLPILGSASGGGWNSTAYSLEDLLVKSFQITTSTPIIRMTIGERVPVYLGQTHYFLMVSQASAYAHI